jgi:site-specific recombinase XerD
LAYPKLSPTTRRQVEIIFKQLLIKCGLQSEGYVPHSLRHGFARQKLDDGVSLRKVQRLLDHSSIKTTERYLDTDEEELTEAMGIMGSGVKEE